MKSSKDYLVIGKILKPFGLQGEVKVYPITDSVERFFYLSFAFIKKMNDYKRIEIKQVRRAHNAILMKFRGYETRQDVEDFRGKYLFIDREHAIPLEKGNFYYYDIRGCRVRTSDGIILGKVADIQNAGSCDVYVVQSEDKPVNEWYIPAISDVVKRVDIETKEIEIEVVEGLL